MIALRPKPQIVTNDRPRRARKKSKRQPDLVLQPQLPVATELRSIDSIGRPRCLNTNFIFVQGSRKEKGDIIEWTAMVVAFRVFWVTKIDISSNGSIKLLFCKYVENDRIGRKQPP